MNKILKATIVDDERLALTIEKLLHPQSLQ
jgi:hypothetical protein